MTKEGKQVVRFEVRSDMSKADEVEVLTKIAAGFAGTGCYLQSLFSEKFIAYVQNQIKNDIGPDVMTDWAYQIEVTRREMHAQESNATKKLEDKNSTILALRQEVASLQRDFASKSATLSFVSQTNAELTGMVDSLTTEVADLRQIKSALAVLKAALS